MLIALERECTLNLLIVSILVHLKEIEVLLGRSMADSHLHIPELAFKVPDLCRVGQNLLFLKIVRRDNV